MARIDALPSIDIIHGFRGILDFYLWKGIPCVRKWPHTPPSHLTAGTLAAAALFGEISHDFHLIAPLELQALQLAAKDQPRTARDLYMTAAYGHLHQEAVAPPPPPEPEMYDAYVCLRDLKPPNTHGGAGTAGVWTTRDLTEEQADAEDVCTLIANQFVLAPGTYRVLITCPAYRTRTHIARLYNVTAAATILLGSCEYVHANFAVTTRCQISGRFTVAADQTLEVQHIIQTHNDTYDFGYRSGYCDNLYTIVELWREAN